MNDLSALPPPEKPAETPPESRPRRRSVLPWLTAVGFVVLAGALAWVWQHPLAPPVSTEPMDRLIQQVSALEARVTHLEQRPEPPVPDLAPLTARITALEQRPTPDLAPLAARVTALEDQRSATVAATPDLQPLIARITALEQKPSPDISGLEARVAALETKQRTDDKLAARVAALEAGQQAMQATLTQRLDATVQMMAHLMQVERVGFALAAGQKLADIAGMPPALARFSATPPPTEASLRLSFPEAARKALSASRPSSDNGALLSRLWSSAQGLVTVREGDHILIGDPTAGVLDRAHTALAAGDLAAATAAVASLRGPAADAMAGWLDQARALLDARAALAAWAAHA